MRSDGEATRRAGAEYAGQTGLGFTRRRFGAMTLAAATALLTGGGTLGWTARSEAADLDLSLHIGAGSRATIGDRRLDLLGFGLSPERAHSPGPVLRVMEGDVVSLRVTNGLSAAHSFSIDGVCESGPIAPGETARLDFEAPPAGTYCYRDALAAPINGLLGLHGVMVVMPDGDPQVPFPGGPSVTRQYVWAMNAYDSAWGRRALRGLPIELSSYRPDVFTINGRFGAESVEARDTSPRARMGEPALIRLVNCGLLPKSLHFHGEHPLVLRRSKTQLETVGARKDSIFLDAEEIVDVLLPFSRPTDGVPVPAPGPGETDLKYPIHDHHELTQTLGEGAYPNGLLSELVFLEGGT